jgi:hypothetical protein
MQGSVYPPGCDIKKSQITVQSVPSMIYQPMEFERSSPMLTLWHLSIYTSSEATFVVPKGKMDQSDTFFTQKGQHLWNIISQILKIASENEGFIYTHPLLD